MGLDIWSSDDEKHFHIGYIGFSTVRSYFILHYSIELYNDYEDILKAVTLFSYESSVDEDEFQSKLGDLDILISHSDCDGELTSSECKQLLPCLVVDEDKITSLEKYSNNPKYNDRIIKLMYDFIDLVEYCAKDSSVKLIFG